MQLTNPFFISSRLMAALKIGGATIQLERAGQTSDGRDRFQWAIDLPDGSEHTGRDLKSGVGGCTMQKGFENLLSFLSAAGESFPDGENAYLFPAPVCEWANKYQDEILLLQLEIAGEKFIVE